MSRASTRQILRLLKSEYGAPEWRPDGTPLSTLVQTILSQNTSDINSGRAFQSLRNAFPHWDAVLKARAAEIAAAIRAGGLADVKAKRIKQTLEEILRERGGWDLDFLKDLPMEEAIGWLKRLPGVGDKTAACVLLFSLGRPALPVDTHILRVAKRLGLLPDTASASQAHRLLQEAVPQQSVFAFHVLMIEHGRKTCKAQRPRCPSCVLRGICPGCERFFPHHGPRGKITSEAF